LIGKEKINKTELFRAFVNLAIISAVFLRSRTRDEHNSNQAKREQFYNRMDQTEIVKCQTILANENFEENEQHHPVAPQSAHNYQDDQGEQQKSI
jgi:hypothetical protein